ncbi:MAG: hypothetical protein WC975_14025 [Phycisphaerae bacterium]
MELCDFSKSFLTFRIDLTKRPAITVSHKPPTTLNNARIQLECVCDLTNRITGKATRYVLGASCKTERVGVVRDIWTQPNADFCPIVSCEEAMLVKSWQKNDMGVKRYPESLGVQPERQVERVADAWDSLKIHIVETPAYVLSTVDRIIAAVFDHKCLVGRLEYDDGDYHVRIDHPIKTINVSERDNLFQTDTGPVLLPDFSRLKKDGFLIEVFDLAYSAFNDSAWSEFIVNVPTPIADGLSVNHYSKTRRIENMLNQIFTISN